MRQPTKQSYQQRLVRVLNYIQDNLDADLSLEQLAAEACFSNFHFHRVFSAMLGESVKELVRRLRLERAALQLQAGDDSVLDIAQRAGFESDTAFARAFKARAGVTPTVFRRSPKLSLVCAPSGVRYNPAERITAFAPLEHREINMNVTIKQIDDMRVAYVRHTGPYSECAPAWDTLCTTLAPEGLLGGDAKVLGLGHDDPDTTEPEKIRYDACVTVPEDFTGLGEVSVQTISGGRYGVTTHFGSYDNLIDTYRTLFGQWLVQSEFELADKPCFEVYLNDPESTEPEDLITDIYLPLQGGE